MKGKAEKVDGGRAVDEALAAGGEATLGPANAISTSSEKCDRLCAEIDAKVWLVGEPSLSVGSSMSASASLSESDLAGTPERFECLVSDCVSPSCDKSRTHTSAAGEPPQRRGELAAD